MILTFLIILVSLAAVSNMATAIANKDMYLAIHKEAGAHKPQGIRIVFMNMGFSVIIGSLWVIMAFTENDWRFAAIYLIPFTTNLMTRAVLK